MVVCNGNNGWNQMLKNALLSSSCILVCELGQGASSLVVNTQSHHGEIIVQQDYLDLLSFLYSNTSKLFTSIGNQLVEHCVKQGKHGKRLPISVMGLEIETSSCVVAHELNEEWASMIEKYVRQIEEMQVELCATIKELEEFVAMIPQQ